MERNFFYFTLSFYFKLNSLALTAWVIWGENYLVQM